MPTSGNRELGQRRIQQLVEENYAALYRYAYRLSGSAADAEDLTQEAFCKAQANLVQLRDQTRARPWLFSILRNAYLHRIRSERNASSVSLEGVGELPERLPESAFDVDLEQLPQALSELPEPFRTPLILFYFEEFSYRDIAEQMEVPLGTVMSRLARAKAYLRGRLQPPIPETAGPPNRRATNGL